MRNFFLQIALLACILSGCSRKLKPAELDVLGTENCTQPCWRGIVPGITTADETINVFQSWQAENKGKWKRNTGSNDVLSWDYICWLEENWPEICLTVDDQNIISKVDLRFSSPSLRLKDVIEKYNYPDGYTIELCVDCSGYIITVYYPEYGLFFLFRGSGKLQITQTMKISRAVFFAPTDREVLINNKVGYRD